MRDNKWVRLLAYITGLVNQRLLLQCEYLIAENRVLRSHVTGRLRLSDAERSTLAEVAKRLGRRHLAEVASTLGRRRGTLGFLTFFMGFLLIKSQSTACSRQSCTRKAMCRTVLGARGLPCGWLLV